jgi:hypothetical protein
MQQHAIDGLRQLYEIAAAKVSNRYPTVVGDSQSDVQVAKNPLQFHSVHIVLLGLTGLLNFRNHKFSDFGQFLVETSELPAPVPAAT